MMTPPPDSICQRDALRKIGGNGGKWLTAEELGIHLSVLKALHRRGMVEMKMGGLSRRHTTTAIWWRLTKMGHAIYANLPAEG